ncbi:PH domain-containing protein [Aestuariibacter sp. A3R04]|uniref:PH domain-containing protein n=1 Tax=Aestuariibacter sp. A3R04 TaxID=2841571 RepID=UPI001C0909D2|nr:PH domain-containing protein [Aestuariibacter sp. A3R04]MBU3021447.1 PH domain-containing protein [Aestuariibacter sp. A3R04]
MNDVNAAEQCSDSGSWRRLSPIAIVYFIVSNIIQFVRQFIVVISALAYSASTAELQNTAYFVPVVSALLLSTVVSGVLSYWFYQYRIRQQHVEIRSGVIKRRNINLPFWRIQNVKILRPFYYRITDYVVMVLDTAGSADEEAKIVAVSSGYAQRLKQQILLTTSQSLQQDHCDRPGDSSPAEAGREQAHFDETVINRRSVTDLILHGLTNNRVWIIMGALAPFYDDIAGGIYGYIDKLGLSLDALVVDEHVAWWQLSLYVITMMVLVLAMMASVSVIGSIFTYYNFTLSRTADRYIRRSGLFSQQEVSMRESRVQKVAIKQDWLDYLLGRANFFFEQNKTGDRQEQELSASNKMLVPSVTESEARFLAADIMPGNATYEAHYKPISIRFVTRYFFLAVIPLFASLTVAGFQREGIAILLVSIPVSLLLQALIYCRWRRWGYHIDNRYLYVRKGIIGIDRYCFELHKVQQVVVTQSVLMQRRSLANVRFVLASGDVSIPFLPQEDAYSLANSVLLEVETQRRSWM